MTAAVEGFYLPLILLTVTLLGGLRVADHVVFLPPSLSALVLAAMLLVVLLRCRALAPERLVNPARSGLANANGGFVLVALFAGTVQVFNAVIPESGLPRLLTTLFLFVLIVNTLAASPDRRHVLRSVTVILGSMFILKFIVLAALSDPRGGWVKRVLLAMVEGATLGTLTQRLFAPVTGYIAFATVVMFLFGLALLPSGERYERPLSPSLQSDDARPPELVP